MADIETLGTKPGSVILSIGAVKFNAREVFKEKFHIRVCPQSCIAAGLAMQWDTVMWWLKQGDEARKGLSDPQTPMVELHEALRLFTKYALSANSADNIELWGNGANFDNALLKAAYDACSLEAPWKFYNDRCYRTVKALHPNIPMAKHTGTHHNALDDARSQAEHLIQLPSFQHLCVWEHANISI